MAGNYSLLHAPSYLYLVVVGFSTNADTIYRSNLPYRFTIFISTPLSPDFDTVLQVTGGKYHLAVIAMIINPSVTNTQICYIALSDEHVTLQLTPQ